MNRITARTTYICLIVFFLILIVSFKIFAMDNQFPKGFPNKLVSLWQTLEEKSKTVSSYISTSRYRILTSNGNYNTVVTQEWWKDGRSRKETRSSFENNLSEVFAVTFIFDGRYQWMYSPQMPDRVTRYDRKTILKEFHDQITMQDLVKMVRVDTLSYLGQKLVGERNIHIFTAKVLPGGYMDLAWLEEAHIEWHVDDNNGMLMNYIIYDTNGRSVQDYEVEEIVINIPVDEKLLAYEPVPDTEIRDWTADEGARERLIEESVAASPSKS